MSETPTHTGNLQHSGNQITDNDLQDTVTKNISSNESLKPVTSKDSSPSKKKNARKRAKLKSLQMPKDVCDQSLLSNSRGNDAALSTPSTSCVMEVQERNSGDAQKLAHLDQSNVMSNTSSNFNKLHISSHQIAQHLHAQSTNSVQDFFMNQVIPLYGTANTRYAENLAHHPQFQVTHNSNLTHVGLNSPQMYHNNYRYTSSAPNSPLVQGNLFNSSSIPFSPLPQLNIHSPKYLQNLMQHPLLSHPLKSPSSVTHMFSGSPHLFKRENAQNISPNKKGKHLQPEQKNNVRKKFEQYISKEEVDIGLQNNTLIEGILRINAKQFQHAFVSSTDRSEQDVFIDGIRNRNRALEGDIVIVQLLEEKDNGERKETETENDEVKQKKGKVVYIKERIHTRTCIGSLKLMPDKNRQKALFIPRDYRVPRLNIPCTFWPDNFYTDSDKYENTLFSAKILDWFDIRFALGKIVCNIGESGDMQSETKAILAQTDVDITPFGPEVRHLFPHLDYVIPEEEIKLREDCRKLCIFSIDPNNCRDIDDAVSCRKLENGNFEVGVHISDVSHFLTENTMLDEKVAEKATTIYMVEKAYHMLPDELCMLCSLFPGVDKLAFSVFWEITDDAEISRPRFSKSVIHSCCQLAYEHAQAILEDDIDTELKFPEIYNGFKYSEIQETIKNLGNISSILRRRRFEGGALRIDQPKVSFTLSPSNGMPESFCIYKSKESHQLIEEFMLLANMSVATKIYEDYPNLAFLRCHPEPSGYMLKQLAKALKPMGIDLEITSAGDIYRSLQPYVGPTSNDRGKAMVLSMLCAKPMARAKYFCAGGYEEDFHHYALNVPLYTHFTSPIRRYADIMVHRLLSASLKYRDVPKWEVDYVRLVAAQCNRQKYNAKRAGELSTELYTLKYIEMHSPVSTEAVVVEVREKYIDVIIVAMGLNRRIFFNNDFPGDYNCIKNDAGTKLSIMELTWHATQGLPEVKQSISVFSTLKVEMHRGDDMVKIEVRLVRPDHVDPTL